MIKSVLDDLVSQIERSFVYAEREFLADNVQRIVLCGGGAKFTGIETYLSERLQLPVTIANPFQKVTVDPKMQGKPVMDTFAPQMMAAMGEVL